MAEGQPVVILPENYSRLIGRDAQRTNIMAAKLVADTVRTTLGPKGMDKMLVDAMGDIVITNDGVTILKEMEIEHPAAKMLVEVAKTQEEEVGDGTTTAVVLTGELLKKAEQLLDQEVHPTVIAKGYQDAANKAEEILKSIAIDVDTENREILEKVVKTAMMGKSTSTHPKLFKIVVDAVLQVIEKEDGRVLDLDNIKLVKKVGGSIEETELVKGVIIDKERVNPNMPKKITGAKIALVNAPFEIEKTEIDAQIRIESPDQMEAFLKKEEEMLKNLAEKVKEVGANVLFVQKGIDDVAQYYLAKAGILAVRRVSESDMKVLARATGAKIVTNIDDLTEESLGYAEEVSEEKVAGEGMIFVRECKNPKAVTIFIRGGAEHIIDEVERSIEDALGDLKVVFKTGKVVAGGGSPEMEVAKELRKYASQIGGREQLAVESFAEALESIPRTLAENAGLDPIDIIVSLKAEHESGNVWSGVDIDKGSTGDMYEIGVLEPLSVKVQAIKSAAEAATMILRIDDLIAAKKLNKEEGKGPQQPPMM